MDKCVKDGGKEAQFPLLKSKWMDVCQEGGEKKPFTWKNECVSIKNETSALIVSPVWARIQP